MPYSEHNLKFLLEMQHSFLRSFSWVALLLAGVLLSGCMNDPTTGTTTVNGQVVTYKSNQPVPNAWVQVWHETKQGNYAAVGTAYPTDAQGRFDFSFDATDKYGYIVMATAAPGYFTDWAFAPGLTAGRANKNIAIQAYAPAWFKIHLANTLHQKQYSITVGGYYGGSSPGGTDDYFYNPKDTTFIRRALVIYQPTSVSWGIIDINGKQSQGYQVVNPAALDTIPVNIPF